jgi:hypothetical protein
MVIGQIIVFLSILAIFALTSLLSREAQPLPPRPVRAPRPDGARPVPPAARSEAPGAGIYRTAERSPSTAERIPPGRFPETTPAARASTSRGLQPDDGLVIIESTAGPAGASAVPYSSAAPAATARNPRGYTSRRTTRGRSAPSPSTAKATDPARPRALTSFVTKSMAETRSRPLQIAPLSSLVGAKGAPLAPLSAVTSPAPPPPLEPPQVFTSASVRSLLATSGKLREIAALSEILQPPRALRPLRRRR